MARDSDADDAIALCAVCAGRIGGAWAGPDAEWRPAKPGETCEAAEHDEAVSAYFDEVVRLAVEAGPLTVGRDAWTPVVEHPGYLEWTARGAVGVVRLAAVDMTPGWEGVVETIPVEAYSEDEPMRLPEIAPEGVPVTWEWDAARDAATYRGKVADVLRRVFYRCPKHPAFDADNCPGCGTSLRLGGAS